MWELLFAAAIVGTLSVQPSTTWGGNHVEMQVTSTGAHLEFDCARGTIDEPLETDAKGTFRLKGTFTAEHGGPVREDEAPRTLKAMYSGTIVKDTMTLKIVIGTGGDREEEEYVLVRNRPGNVMKCR